MEELYISKFAESSLSRLVQYIQDHDCGTITAYRSTFVHKDNQKRNQSLKLKLMALGYHLTDVKGACIENFGTDKAQEVGEHVFFIVDWKDKRNLEKDLRDLGEEFDQDFILYIPKGGKDSHIIGTNHTGFPGYGVKKYYPVLKLGKDDNKFLTRVGGRPFYFSECVLREYYCANNSSRGYTSVEADKHWQDLKVE